MVNGLGGAHSKCTYTYSHVHNMDLSNLLNNLTLIVMKSKLSLKRVPYYIFKIQIVNLNSRGKNTICSTRVDMSTGQAV